MYGWRGRLGWIGPSTSDTVLLEFYHILPEGILVTPYDLGVRALVEKEFQGVMGRFEEAAKILKDLEVEAIVVGGTPPITKLGFEADKEVIRKVEALTGLPTSTAPTAEIEAMRFLGMKRIALVSPYVEELNRHLKSYLEYCGFEVPVIKGLGIVKNVDLSKGTPEQTYRMCKEAFMEAKGKIDGVFFQCPRWPTVESIELFEKDLGIPMVTTASAIVWKGLSLLKVNQVQPGYGKLFESFDDECY